VEALCGVGAPDSAVQAAATAWPELAIDWHHASIDCKPSREGGDGESMNHVRRRRPVRSPSRRAASPRQCELSSLGIALAAHSAGGVLWLMPAWVANDARIRSGAQWQRCSAQHDPPR
jgi:hypothetical protein